MSGCLSTADYEITAEMRRAVENARSADVAIATKMDALFYLKSLDSPAAAHCLEHCLSHSSVLQDHEVAYILGQMKQPNSVPFLLAVARDEGVSGIVRHEAIEALGNFEDAALIPEIEAFAASDCAIVRESAVLAVRKLAESGADQQMVGQFGTRDPAFPHTGSFEAAVEKFLRGGLVEKYQAIFYLRDLNTREAVDVLAAGFNDPSDLLRHEIAYVFGQMENEHSVDALVEVLENPDEMDIVRHEAAEALGNIGTPRCVAVLRQYLDSDVQILRESVEAGLGIYTKNASA
ncbi:deoxyhypusine monooxygenase [Pancytospora philotis]|nr:deoxyhypusine monooxygenase [Pancytospora philotis]